MYIPTPLDTSNIELPAEFIELRERIAEHVHDVWAQGRIAQGWVLGPERDDDKKHHPNLVPYQDLPESEKDVDRKTAMETLKVAMLTGWTLSRE